MTKQGYPEQYDVMWAATDSIGQIGLFFSAGVGPIARTFLDYEANEQERLERHMLELPRRGECVKTRADGINNDHQFAEAGCYVFDWSDVHRVSGMLRAYELVAVPTLPLKLEELSPDLQLFLAKVRIPGVVFGVSGTLDVEVIVECLNSPQGMPFGDLPGRRSDDQSLRSEQDVSQAGRPLQHIKKYLHRLLSR